ncbi:MAG: hypothetical protein AAF497_15590, partial [Planctomycetota bacterium]
MNSPLIHSSHQRICGFRWLVKFLLVLVAFVASQSVSAQSQATSEGVEKPLTVSELIQELGGKKYSQRERATRMLIERGLVALDAVRSGLKSSDAEVRTRCKRIERKIVAQDREHRVLGFLSRVSADRPVPGWERFRKRLGNQNVSFGVHFHILGRPGIILQLIA